MVRNERIMTLIIKLSSFELKVLYEGFTLAQVPLASIDKSTVKVEFPSGTWPDSVTTIFKEANHE